MGKISEKRRWRIAEEVFDATLKWGIRSSVYLDEQRERLSIFIIRPDNAHRKFVSDSRPSNIKSAVYAAKAFARPN